MNMGFDGIYNVPKSLSETLDAGTFVWYNTNLKQVTDNIPFGYTVSSAGLNESLIEVRLQQIEPCSVTAASIHAVTESALATALEPFVTNDDLETAVNALAPSDTLTYSIQASAKLLSLLGFEASPGTGIYAPTGSFVNAQVKVLPDSNNTYTVICMGMSGLGPGGETSNNGNYSRIYRPPHRILS